MPHRIVPLALDLSTTVSAHGVKIREFTARTRMLALNALIESAHTGAAGRGFAVIANEVKEISQSIGEVSENFTKQVDLKTHDIEVIGQRVIEDIDNLRGDRLADLALNMIDIIDRNLYERSCDVRWWATDAAVVACCTSGPGASRQATADRLAVILDNYTVYLDIWICDMAGNVLASGRPQRFGAVGAARVADRSWFRKALACAPGAYAVDDISRCAELDNRQVAIYAAPVREGGAASGATIGVLSVFFDWQTQAQTVVDAVRLLPQEKPCTRCLIVDAHGRVLAASDRQGILVETIRLLNRDKRLGHYRDDTTGHVVAYALTPGYETYQGLGWFGVLVQSGQAEADRGSAKTRP